MDFEKNDIAVGAFVLAAIAMFLVSALVVNRARLMTKSYSLRIELTEIAGIDKGVEVIYRGYRAGQVDAVSVTYQPQFRFVVNFSVKKEIKLPTGTKVVVRGKGFSGGRYLDLVPSERAAGGPVIEEDTLLPVELEADLMAKAHDVLGEARNVVRRFQQKGTAEDAIALIHDMRLAVSDLRKTLNNTNALIEENRAQVKSLTSKGDDLLTKRGPALDRSLKNLDEALVHLPHLVQTLEEIAVDVKKHPWKLVRKGGEAAPKLEHKHDASPAATAKE